MVLDCGVRERSVRPPAPRAVSCGDHAQQPPNRDCGGLGNRIDIDARTTGIPSSQGISRRDRIATQRGQHTVDLLLIGISSSGIRVCGRCTAGTDSIQFVHKLGGIAGGDPNFYRYCRNNPTNTTGPGGVTAPVDHEDLMKHVASVLLETRESCEMLNCAPLPKIETP